MDQSSVSSHLGVFLAPLKTLMMSAREDVAEHCSVVQANHKERVRCETQPSLILELVTPGSLPNPAAFLLADTEASAMNNCLIKINKQSKPLTVQS